MKKINHPKKKWRKPEIKTLGFKKTHTGDEPTTAEDYQGS